jgi:hypothetical protein
LLDIQILLSDSSFATITCYDGAALTLLPWPVEPLVVGPLFCPVFLPYKSFHLLCMAKSVHLVSLAESYLPPKSSRALKQVFKYPVISTSTSLCGNGTVAKIKISAAEESIRMTSTLMKRKEYCVSYMRRRRAISVAEEAQIWRA